MYTGGLQQPSDSLSCESKSKMSPSNDKRELLCVYYHHKKCPEKESKKGTQKEGFNGDGSKHKDVREEFVVQWQRVT